METPSSKGPNEEGYYEVVLHDFNARSINGRKYVLDEQTLAAVARAGQKAAKGCLLAEFGNPKLPEDADEHERRQRFFEIHEDSICAALVDVRLTDGVVTANAKLLGPYGKRAKELLEGKPPTFGLRGIAQPNQGDELSLIDIVTFDFINPDH